MCLELGHLKRHFDGREVVRDLSLTLEQGQLLCTLGASGCGKTATLNMIEGFLSPDSGSVWLDGEDITHVPPEQCPVTTISQSYDPLPHMTVLQNVIYGLRFRRVKREQARQKEMHYLEMVGLADYVRTYIQETSRSQQQRVTLARALIAEPKLYLLDESFRNLDAALRTKVRHELKRFQKTLGLTMVLIIHNQEEAIILADRIVTIDQDRLVQNNAPLGPCRKPASLFVAEFMDLGNLVWIEDGRLLEIIKRQEEPKC